MRAWGPFHHQLGNPFTLSSVMVCTGDVVLGDPLIWDQFPMSGDPSTSQVPAWLPGYHHTCLPLKLLSLPLRASLRRVTKCFALASLVSLTPQ